MPKTVSNLLKYIRCFIMIGIVVWACSGIAAAKQIVVLVTGEKMVVDQARVESERVWISWNGLTLSIDKKDVIRIEGGGKKHIIVHETPTEVEEERYQKPPQKPAPKPAANRSPNFWVPQNLKFWLMLPPVRCYHRKSEPHGCKSC